MPAPTGRKPGLVIHAEGFEAIIAARGFLRSHVAREAGITPAFLADLLAHRAGIHPDKADNLAGSIGVKTAALFPELAGWQYVTGIDRYAKRAVDS